MPDHQGSIIALINADCSPSAINSYDEYGIPGIGNAGRFQYTGQIWIPELGLYHYKARLYSPMIGRFMQTDPVGYEGGINLYLYARNDSINLVDRSGKTPMPAVQAIEPLIPNEIKEGIKFLSGFVPVIGDVQGIVETYNEPTPINIGASIVGAFPGFGDLVGAGLRGADNIADIARLNAQISRRSAESIFTASGELTPEAIAGSRKIIDASDIMNDMVPPGYSKYSTQIFQSPSGEFQVHFLQK